MVFMQKLLAEMLYIDLVIYHEAASSSAKRTPPTGARKALATPAAAPQVIKSLRSLSFLKYLSHFQVSRYFREPPCPSKLAMQAPVCTIGPSLPTTNPAATPNIEPKICGSEFKPLLSSLKTTVKLSLIGSNHMVARKLKQLIKQLLYKHA